MQDTEHRRGQRGRKATHEHHGVDSGSFLAASEGAPQNPSQLCALDDQRWGALKPKPQNLEYLPEYIPPQGVALKS